MALMEPGRTYYLIIKTLITWNKYIIQLVSKASQLIAPQSQTPIT